MTEPRQVDCNEVRTLRESQPCRLIREQALRPRVQEERIIVAALTFGEADGQPVDGTELRLD